MRDDLEDAGLELVRTLTLVRRLDELLTLCSLVVCLQLLDLVQIPYLSDFHLREGQIVSRGNLLEGCHLEGS